MSARWDTPRIGIDLGGTKIEGLVLDGSSQVLAGPVRCATPRHDYEATLAVISELTGQLEREAGLQKGHPTIGIGMPGSIVRATGRVQNANSVWLNGRSLGDDLMERLGDRVRLANDANCFALSEAIDGAGADAHSVFGVILGTGCGGGLVFNKQLINGPLGISGEWGHNPLPSARADEIPGPTCWCGRRGCMETWVSGPGLSAQHRARGGEDLNAEAIAVRANQGCRLARAVLQDHTDRLARGLAHVVNIVDPEVIVLGGGLSKLAHLYDDLPKAIAPYLFTDAAAVTIRPPRWGDASGVRGAAWLWGD